MKQPQRNSLRTLVPVSVRSNDAADKTDNRVSVMLPYLPVEKADPVAATANRARAIDEGEGEVDNARPAACSSRPRMRSHSR